MRSQKNEAKTTPRVRATFGLLLALLVAIGLPGAGYAAEVSLLQGRGQEHSHHGHVNEGKAGHRTHSRYGVYFGSREIATIRNYYTGRHPGLPPGLAKRGGNLPPGLEKHLEREGTLPPGLQKRLAPLPYALERQLPPLPASCSCRRALLGADVLIMNTRTGRILDLIRDVVGR